MDVLQQTLASITLLGILAAGIWALRRRGLVRFQFPSRTAHAKRLELLERLQFTAQHSLCLVRVDDQVLAIGLSPSHCQVLQLSGNRCERPAE